MNENNEELYDLLDGGDSGEVIENENEAGTEETGEGHNTLPEEIAESDEIGDYEEMLESVSVGDSDIAAYDKQLDDIIAELVYQRERMDSFQAYIESKDMTLFEKPLEEYTVQEGIGMLIFFLLLFMMIAKLVGGIITCKI